jgi:hypothetical protein
MGRNFEAVERKIARKASLLVNLHKVEHLRKKKIKQIKANAELL